MITEQSRTRFVLAPHLLIRNYGLQPKVDAAAILAMKHHLANCLRFIRNKNTGQYWRPDGTWSSSFEDAQAFKSATDLIDCCQAQGLLQDIQLLVKPSGENAREVIVDLF